MSKSILFFMFLSVTCFGQEVLVDLKEIKGIISKWTEYHNKKDLIRLEALYADNVVFYAEELPRVSCIGIKSKRLQSAKYFHQEVITRPIVAVYSTSIIKASFVKRVTSGSVTKDYDAYLLFKEIDGRLLIVGESDLIADGNAKFTPELGRELKSSTLSAKDGIDADAITTDSSEVAKPDSFQPKEIYFLWGTLAIMVVWVVRTKFRNTRRRAADRKGSTYAPEDKGADFERYVVNRFDVIGKNGTPYFKLLEWRGDKFTNGIYARSTIYPDLEYEFKMGDFVRRFAVECKFRSSLINQVFDIEDRQLSNYLEFEVNKGMPVYIVLGLGGSPSNPDNLFVVSLQNFIKMRPMTYSTLVFHWNDPREKFFFDPKNNSLRISPKRY